MSARNTRNGSAPTGAAVLDAPVTDAPQDDAPVTDAQPQPDAPAVDAPQPDAQPQPDAPLDLDAESASLEIEKTQRVYVDVPGVPRVPTATGSLACVQRQKHADGKLGPMELCKLTIGADKRVQARRHTLEELSEIVDALRAAGIKVLGM